jgi:tetratricopeptide (TPR) repeat protein
MQDVRMKSLKLIALLFFAFINTGAQNDDVLFIQESLQSGNLDKASRLLLQAIAHRPNEGGLINLRGILHAKRNELAEAQVDFESAVRLNPTLTPAWRNLGRACSQTGNVPCAVQAWQHVQREKPADREAHGSLALLYERQGKFAESLRELAAGKEGDSLLEAIDLSALGRLSEAKAVAARMARQPGFTEDDLPVAHGTLDSPKTAGVLAELIEGLDARGLAGVPSLRRLVVAYEQLQRPLDSVRILERIAALEPNNTADLLELARLAEQRKNYKEALGYLAHARDLEPGNGRIHFLFGLIAGELNLPVEAKRSLEQALATDPSNPDYNYALGTVIMSTRDAASAASHFEVYVKAKPSDARGHYALGVAHFTSGAYDKAKEQMKIAETAPDMAGASEYYLGRIARLVGELGEAERRLRKSVELLPGFSETHTELARLSLLKGNIEAARAELEWALQLAPESFQANNQLLVLYQRTHDARAVKQLELLKKLDEDRSKRAELMLRTIEVKP